RRAGAHCPGAARTRGAGRERSSPTDRGTNAARISALQSSHAAERWFSAGHQARTRPPDSGNARGRPAACVIPPFPVYVFDLDGTLVDSERDICGAIHQVLAAYGRADIPQASLRRYIGLHLLDMFLDLGFVRDSIDPMIADY